VAEEPRVKVGVGIMIVKDGQVLLGRRKGAHGEGEYAWPGGHLEFGETLEECIEREIAEEAGIKVRPIRPVSVSNVIKYGRHYLDIQYLVEYLGGEPTVLEPDRIESWAWYNLNSLPEPIFEFALRGLEGYQKNDGVAYFSVKADD
jgi:8-oxo-dGTP diphosphatase